MESIFCVSSDGKILWYVNDITITQCVVPNGITEIGIYAFKDCKSLESIVIPNSVSSIFRNAFSGCTSLEHIYLPECVTCICNGTFDDTKWFEIQPQGPVYINNIFYTYKGEAEGGMLTIKEGTTIIAPGAFYGCTWLVNIVLPESVRHIGFQAFQNCTSLMRIDMPSIASIGVKAFCGCTSLESIDLPKSVTYIGCEAFEGTKWLANQPEGPVYLNDLFYMYKGKAEGGMLTIREGTTLIVSSAFKDCTWLEHISIPESIMEIDWQTFSGCVSLKCVELPDNLVVIDEECFSDCTSLKNIVLPDGIEEIGWRAFSNCTSLESIVIPECVTRIASDTFY